MALNNNQNISYCARVSDISRPPQKPIYTILQTCYQTTYIEALRNLIFVSDSKERAVRKYNELVSWSKQAGWTEGWVVEYDLLEWTDETTSVMLDSYCDVEWAKDRLQDNESLILSHKPD